ncbi:hypothetical protein HR12_20885 [Microbacterium sp. SUBG005]|nr:hypothetical protein HR12_20885 [Microbacterium sp. SUBG005]
MSRWVPKANILFANDQVMASEINRDDSDTRAAIQAIADALITAALQADPDLGAQLAQAIGTAVPPAVSAAVPGAAEAYLKGQNVLRNAVPMYLPDRSVSFQNKAGAAGFLDADNLGLPTDNSEELMARKRGAWFRFTNPISGWLFRVTERTTRAVLMGIRSTGIFYAPGVVLSVSGEPNEWGHFRPGKPLYVRVEDDGSLTFIADK